MSIVALPAPAPEADNALAANARLTPQLSAICGRLNRANADLVDVIAQALETEAWGEAGIRSPAHWLVLRAGVSEARAREIVLLASRREELPVTMGLLALGQLTLEQAAVIAKHAPAVFDASVAELAQFATVPQIRKAISRYVFAPDSPPGSPQSPDATPDQRVIDPPELQMGYERNGTFWLRFTAPADVGALVEAAVKEAKDALFTAGSAAGARPTYGDALVEMAGRSLHAVPSASRSSHYRVYLHIDEHGSWVNGGAALPAPLAAKYLCNGVVQPVFLRDGKPVSVGRAQRIAPERARRLIIDRDRGCCFPGCAATGFVEIHHLDHWAKGGATDTDRMISLCPHHHDAHHRGEFTIRGDPDKVMRSGQPGGLVFRNTYGTVIRYRPPTPADCGAPEPPSTPYIGPTGERLRSDSICFTAIKSAAPTRPHRRQ